MKVLKALAALLTYPEPELLAATPALGKLIAADKRLTESDKAGLAALLASLHADELLDVQERYVEMFDRSRSCSLHLFEHVHGDSRDRGQAMVDLTELYMRHGLEIDAQELPDYLPMFLEFLSTVPEPQALDLLAEPVGILKTVGARLVERESAYAAVFQALARLAGDPVLEAAPGVVTRLADDAPEALDRLWEEEAVTFGPGSCAPSTCSMPVAPRPASLPV